MTRVKRGVRGIRKEIEDRLLEPFDFFAGPLAGQFITIVSDEEMEFKGGEAKMIKIKGINIPANSMVFVSPYEYSKIGHIVSVGEDLARPSELTRGADRALFLAGLDGTIKKGELLGEILAIQFRRRR